MTATTATARGVWLRIGLAAAVPSVALALAGAWGSGLRAPAPTLLVRDTQNRFLGELPAPGDERLGFWPLDEVPDKVAAATLAMEDRRFAWHAGVDVPSVARAAWQNLAAGRRLSGASTIAMQVARMQNPGARGYPRKLLEAVRAMALTARHGRDAVLRHYLRIVPYGHRIHGIGYAARRYLDKPVEDLSWAEVAFLAAIPQAPARTDPFDAAGRARAVERGRRILDRLRAAGRIGDHDWMVARREIENLRLPWRASRPAAALHPLLAFRDRPVEPGGPGPLLATTLDLDLQREIEHLAWRTVVESEERGAGNAAVLVVERGGFDVRAAVGSVGYFDDQRSGAIDYLRLPRSAGSTLKPLLYALALDRGVITPATILDDLGPGPGGVLNADDRYLGPLLPRAALANSRNVPAVDLLGRVGLDAFYAALGDLGLHDGGRPSSRYGLGLALGSLPVTLEGLVTAYTALAGDGSPRTLRWFEARSAGARARVAREAPPPAPLRFVSPETARLVTLFLADPQARLPSFPRSGAAEYDFPVAIKTGTSSGYRDAWTVAWSSRYLVGVWVGHPDVRPMGELSGFRIAARLAKETLQRLHADRHLDPFQASPFPPPRDFEPARLCALTGHGAGPHCDRVVTEWLAPADAAAAATDPCRAHRRVAIDARTGRPVDPKAGAPAWAVTERTVVELPARYAAWLDRQTRRAAAPSPRPGAADTGAGAATAATAAATAAADATATATVTAIRVLSPEPGARLLFDPEAPAALNTVALRAVADPEVAQLVWYIDGRPFATVGKPYSTRWPLAAGEHFIQAREAFGEGRSKVVRLVVE